MPLYEYYCKSCDGVFETIRQIAQASSPAPCPVCSKKAQRIPPTSFNAFTMRDGYPRRIPDRGTYWHLGKKSKGELSELRDRKAAAANEAKRMRDSGIPEVQDRGFANWTVDDD